MAKFDYKGARGSGQGDDFHELWALRHALDLLLPGNPNVAMTVEGLRPEDEAGKPEDTWDGVDCSYFKGSASLSDATGVVIDQVKHSGADPDDNWTISRLTDSKAKTKNNSVIRKLATAFLAIDTSRPDLLDSNSLTVRLVSNQPLSPNVTEALAGAEKRKEDLKKLKEASGLKPAQFERFKRSLDFSLCGKTSLMALEESAVRSIAAWTDENAKVLLPDLLSRIRELMRPRAKKDFITGSLVLGWFGFGDATALFPCPPALQKPRQLIPRQETESLAQALLGGRQFVCVHGEGGCGKTTLLQELETKLPKNSQLIVYDCYGGGKYLNTDTYRHRTRDAFIQLSNQLAAQCRMPYFLARAEPDYPRSFVRRLRHASEIVAAQDASALLVIAIDAADNAVTAAKQINESDKCFVPQLLGVGDLPANVRVIIAARTGRLPELSLPSKYQEMPLSGFGRDETAIHARQTIPDVSDSWIDDLHDLSKGNPRVQVYALDYGKGDRERTLNYLRPKGKDLGDVFSGQLAFALSKNGHAEELEALCAGLIELPRPVPVEDLGAVTNLDVNHIRDICADLSPALRLHDDQISFADEDFENFVREHGKRKCEELRKRVAERLYARRMIDPYAAAGVSSALVAADRGSDLIAIIKNETELQAIVDPALRRRVQRQRLRLAMKVCREANNSADALMTILIGAEALKTDHAVERLVVENLDLAATLMTSEARRIVLQDPENLEHHGPLLYGQMAAAAIADNRLEVRELGRQIDTWNVLRNQHLEDLKSKRPQFLSHDAWEFPEWSLAAGLETVLRMQGAATAVRRAFGASPRSWVFMGATTLVRRLLARSELALVEQCSKAPPLSRTPWRMLFEVQMCLADAKRTPSNIPADLQKLVARGLLQIDTLKDAYREKDAVHEVFDLAITACELEVSRKGDIAGVLPILRHLSSPEARRWDKLNEHQVRVLDVLLRATSLLEGLEDREFSASTFLLKPPPEAEKPDKLQTGRPPEEPKPDRGLNAFVSSLVPLYLARARTIRGDITGQDAITALNEAIKTLGRDNYDFNRNVDSNRMRAVTSHSVARLMLVATLDRKKIFELAFAANGPDVFAHNAASLLADFSIDPSLHQSIVLDAAARAQQIRSERASADDKISGFVALARAVTTFSPGDASQLFDIAAILAKEIDQNVMHELTIFEPLASQAYSALEIAQRRQIAHRVAIVASDASIRLSGHDGFPWERVTETIATLDPALALACVARWDDADIVRLWSTLPSLILRTLEKGTLTPLQLTSLPPLLRRPSEQLFAAIASSAAGSKLRELVEELARGGMMLSDTKPLPALQTALDAKIAASRSERWVTSLRDANTFLATKPPRTETNPEEARPDPLANVDWPKQTYTTPAALKELLELGRSEAKRLETYFTLHELFDRIRDAVPFASRAAYLAALLAWRTEDTSDRLIVDEIARCLREWPMTPAIQGWCATNLAPMLVDRLPELTGYLQHGGQSLPTVLNKLDLPPTQKLSRLLEGIEKHVDTFDAPTLYHLVGQAAAFLDAQSASAVCEQFSQRQLDRIPTQDRDVWDLTDIPTQADRALARFIYAHLSDIELGTRWRAAHSVRILARLGETSVLDHLVGCYERREEPAFRAPGAPFYWLAARLWLMVAFERVSYETPSVLSNHGAWLLSEATNSRIPHVLNRHYAKAAAQRLAAQGTIKLDSSQELALKSANTSPLARASEKNRTGGTLRSLDQKEGRFHFDSMDTLPSWYEPAVNVFSDLSGSEFVASAESWIVDRWGVTQDTWRWTDEKRRGRMGEGLSTLHRHGSLPAKERFNTYLEWHAMWCAIGEFLPTRALVAPTADDDDYGTLERQLARDYLTEPPIWLADLRGPKPLEVRFWQPPEQEQEKIEAWVEAAKEADFLQELFVVGDDTVLVVDTHNDAKSSAFSQTARVVSALVQPDTASALCRAAQSSATAYDYGLPPEDDDFLEINEPPYELRGWLKHRDGDLRFDDMDPLRFDVGKVAKRPGTDVTTRLKLKEHVGPPPSWTNATGEVVFSYMAWSESPNSDPDGRQRYETAFRSNGHRLVIKKEALHHYLTEVERDLIVEVEIRRDNDGYGNSRTDSQKKDAAYDRVYILRRDGAIESADGRVGSWTTHSPGVGKGS